MTTTAPRPAPSVLDGRGARPLLDGQRTTGEQLLVKVFVAVPLLALLAAVPLAWGWGLSWIDIGLAVFFYLLSGFSFFSNLMHCCIPSYSKDLSNLSALFRTSCSALAKAHLRFIL